MPLQRKDHLDRSVWSWAENTDPNIISNDKLLTAYKVKFPRCKAGVCRRNCRNNPYCLSGLGESSLNIDGHETSSIQDSEFGIRDKESFVGLKNLGATCYVNSLLQLWFHNPVFRNGIFDWEPLKDPDEVSNGSLTVGDEYVPRSVIGHLQQLFALLKYSKCRYIDPTKFVEALGLDTGTQQDAQEFSKLFISLLENRLEYQTLPHVRDLIINNFRGKYSYITRCCKCQTESISPSLFYELELNLKDNPTLADCLSDFLKEEKLDGANCYYCVVCNEKQEAFRFIKLEVLPPVLNLQLLRFVYDRKKGHKKKVTSSVQFPMTLDMSEYLRPKPDNPCLYNLTAVLIHKGVSANSGHYVAHILNTTTNEWYMFNDENVEKMKGKKLELTEDDEDKVQKSKKRLPKGFLRSNNAYMLVYTAADFKVSDDYEKSLNPILDKYVQQQNKLFQEWFDNLALNKKEEIEQKGEKLAIHNLLSVGDDSDVEDIDVLSVDWLSTWLKTTESNFKPIDNAKLLCSHSCLNPDLIKNCKYVSSNLAAGLYDRYGGGPRIRGITSFCQKCVSSKCFVLNLKAKTMEESKEILNLLKKEMQPAETAYFVDKNDLRSWRRQVLERLDKRQKTDVSQEEDEDSNEESKKGEEKEIDTNGKTKENKILKRESETEESEEEELGFNEAIICIHGNLTIDASTMRLVPAKVWEIFNHYFPEAPKFKNDTIPCQECQNLASKDLVVRETYQREASLQKNQLKDLNLNRNRPQMGKEPLLYLLPIEQFYIPWKKYIRSEGKKCSPPPSMEINQLLCPHGSSKYNMQLEEDRNKVVAVTPVEWKTLTQFYPSHVEVTIDEKLSSTPEVCSMCFLARLDDEQKALLDYARATVTVRYLATQQLLETVEEESSKVKNKRGCVNGKDWEPVTAMNCNDTHIRRSSRKRRVPGQKEMSFVVSSSNTLRDLKCKIMDKWAVAPYDQHISTVDGLEFTNDKSTLASLGILPNSILHLRVDEPTGDANDLEDIIETDKREPEEGFKGTELLRNL